MAEKSSLVTRQCVAWRTEIPYIKRLRVSPYFNFQFSFWRLSMGCSEKNEYYIKLKRQPVRHRFRTFDVTTYLESVAGGSVLSQTVTVGQTPHRIWSARGSDVLEKLPALKDYGEFTVVCVFRFFNEHSAAKEEGDFLPMLQLADMNSEASMESLSKDFLKLFESDLSPDVNLKCEDRVFPAHRAVLSTRSEVFAAMFRNKTVENETRTVDIVDVEATVLHVLLKYLYSGKIPDLSEDTVRNLYAASDKYAVNTLKKACCEWMVDGLTVENCLEILRLADAHVDGFFKDKVITFILNNTGVFHSESWIEFSEENAPLAVEVYRKSFAEKAPNSNVKRTLKYDRNWYTNSEPVKWNWKISLDSDVKNPPKSDLNHGKISLDSDGKNPPKSDFKDGKISLDSNGKNPPKSDLKNPPNKEGFNFSIPLDQTGRLSQTGVSNFSGFSFTK